MRSPVERRLEDCAEVFILKYSFCWYFIQRNSTGVNIVPVSSRIFLPNGVERKALLRSLNFYKEDVNGAAIGGHLFSERKDNG